MIDEKQQIRSVDGELIGEVTATVLETLQATGQMTGGKKEHEKRQQESKTVDLTGLFFCILENFGLC